MEEIKKVVWMEELSTGNRAIDVQHKYLLDIINELADVLLKREGRAKMGNILQLLQYYTEWHFGREEECMERTHCPTACKNKEAHGKFLNVVQDFKNEFASMREPGELYDLGVRIYKVLTGWLVSHIAAIDSKLGEVSQNDKTNFPSRQK